jgi:hypothetical protein
LLEGTSEKGFTFHKELCIIKSMKTMDRKVRRPLVFLGFSLVEASHYTGSEWVRDYTKRRDSYGG